MEASSPLDVLVLCYEYPPIGGGGGIGAQQYAEAWVSAGHRVSVLTSGAAGLPPRETVNGVEVIRVRTLLRTDRATATFTSMFSYLVSGFLHLLANRRNYRHFHVLNTHFSIPTGPLGWAASRLLRRPNVLTIIGGDIYDPSKRSSPHRSAVLRRLNRFLIEAADRVIAISSDTKERAQRTCGVHRPIRVIHYGFVPHRPGLSAPPAISPPSPEPAPFQLIGVGRLVPRKDFASIVRALAELPQDVALWLVGDGPLETELRELAHGTGVASRVHLLGYRTRDEIHALLRRSDCFVLSSLHEGLGIVVQEAMDAGLPVVATNNGGQVDLIRQPRGGLLVEPGNPAALAQAIRSLVEDRALAKSMGEHNAADIKLLHIDENSQLYLEEFLAAGAAKGEGG